MKKTLLLLFTLTIFSTYLSAQNQEGLFSLGANLSYGSKKDLIGFGGRAQYGFTDRIRASAEYKYYLDRRDWSEWQINMDLHYLLGLSDDVAIYPISGLRMSRWTVDTGRGSGVPADARYKRSTTRLGVNLGLGAQVQLDYHWFLQIEPKYEISKHYSQFSGTVGLMFQF